MKKLHKDQNEETKPDLKHDTMEFAASAEGDDPMDMDLFPDEDDAVSAEELDEIENIDIGEKANALNSVEIDRQADADSFFSEDDDEDEL